MADLVVFGDVLTMDEANPRATAVAVEDGRIVAVGSDADVASLIGPATVVHDVGEACIMPGFIEAHGHPMNEAVLLGDPVVDIRPVTIPDADGVLAAIDQAVADAGPEGAVLNGWDPLLQKGLADPTMQWMNELSPDKPLIILHNSGHAAYFNSHAATAAGVTRDTPDPEGARFGRDESGDLDGGAYESAAVMAIAGPLLVSAAARFGDLIAAECARMNAVGVTTVSEMAFDPKMRAPLAAAAEAGALTTRLRLYEMSGPKRASDVEPGAGDDLVRQVGIKIWSDGSPWIGNIALSFPYLDTPATRALGMACSHGHANYTGEQIVEISTPYYERGWQIACHAHGDEAITMVLDAWEKMLTANPRPDHRLRLEHVGAMRPDQFRRAADLGVTCSLFVDHLYYWATFSSVTCSGPITAGTGPQRVRRWLRATGSRSTTTARSRPRIRCATSPTPSTVAPAAGGCSRRTSASRSRRRCEPRPSTPRGTCSATTPSESSSRACTRILLCCPPIRSPSMPAASPTSR